MVSLAWIVGAALSWVSLEQPESPGPLADPLAPTEVDRVESPPAANGPEEPPPVSDTAQEKGSSTPAVSPPASEPETAPTSSDRDSKPGWSTMVKGRRLEINPFITVIGGGYMQLIDNTGTAEVPDQRESRFTTIALSRLGVRARWGELFELESELEVNAGPYGTSVWEGQAALQIRNQLLRLKYKGLRIDAGRITDPASLDYFSYYAVGNMLLSDDLARFPLLVSGFNRGNGVLARYAFFETGLSVGFTANAGNPTSTTATVMVGGTFPPFGRFYQVPWAEVGRDARGFPTPSFHVYLLSPSVMYDHEYVGIQFAYQYFDVNTNTNSRSDDHITGYNLRGGIQGRFWKGRIRPFVNGSRVFNDVVDPDDTAVRSDEKYQAIVGNGGIDIATPLGLGVGTQYAFIHEQQGRDSPPIIQHVFNVGAGYLVLPFVSLDARYALAYECSDFLACSVNREHRFYLSLKAMIGDLADSTRRP